MHACVKHHRGRSMLHVPFHIDLLHVSVDQLIGGKKGGRHLIPRRQTNQYRMENSLEEILVKTAGFVIKTTGFEPHACTSGTLDSGILNQIQSAPSSPLRIRLIVQGSQPESRANFASLSNRPCHTSVVKVCCCTSSFASSRSSSVLSRVS